MLIISLMFGTNDLGQKWLVFRKNVLKFRKHMVISLFLPLKRCMVTSKSLPTWFINDCCLSYHLNIIFTSGHLFIIPKDQSTIRKYYSSVTRYGLRLLNKKNSTFFSAFFNTLSINLAILDLCRLYRATKI